MRTLTAEFRDSLVHVTLDNPEAANSFGPEEARQLRDLLNFPGLRQAEGLIFSSAHRRFFSTGGNLKFYAALKKPREGLIANRRIRKTLRQLSRLKIPTVAVVTGDCFGGGMELVGAFDYIVATPQSLFAFWQRRIGLTFGWGGAELWHARLPAARLKLLALEARPICAYEALELGLVDEIQPASRAVARAEDWLHSQRSLPRQPLKALKPFDPQREVENFERLWMNPEHKSSLKTFR